jgi:hypothetical protein
VGQIESEKKAAAKCSLPAGTLTTTINSNELSISAQTMEPKGLSDDSSDPGPAYFQPMFEDSDVEPPSATGFLNIRLLFPPATINKLDDLYEDEGIFTQTDYATIPLFF